jgi:2,4-dienoyl-CoA reductase-like NADH-dependent reductase (Old Yellow Enzyme family)
MEAAPSGLATSEGFCDRRLQIYYRARARGGVGMVVMEAMRPLAPSFTMPHLGLYADAYIPGLRDCITAIHREGAAVLVMVDQPYAAEEGHPTAIVEAVALAAWRARAAGADGIMLSAAEGSLFPRLLEPTQGAERLQALLLTVETMTKWLGRQCLIGVRVAVEEQLPGGLPLQDARVLARRLTSVGAGLIEVVVRVGREAPVAQFPGWCVPIASAFKALVEVPILVGGQLDDPELAEFTLHDQSADLIAIGERIRDQPRWPEYAQSVLINEKDSHP